jgi:hypothetical protein
MKKAVGCGSLAGGWRPAAGAQQKNAVVVSCSVSPSRADLVRRHTTVATVRLYFLAQATSPRPQASESPQGARV